MQIILIPFSIGQDPSFEGLHRVDHLEIMDAVSAWIFGAWQFGHRMISDEGIIEIAQDWFDRVGEEAGRDDRRPDRVAATMPADEVAAN